MAAKGDLAMAWAFRALLTLLLLLPLDALACGNVASRGRVIRAATTDEAVTITFLGHASFHIVTPRGIGAVTDYSGSHVPDTVPDLVTMNHAHATHFSDVPDTRIRHVLRGWAIDGKPAHHDMRVGDLRVRNIPTNIRNWGGGTEYYGNSIFVFEAAGLCIAHLGHLHHLLNDDDLAELGSIDILMTPIDGSFTVDQADMVAIVAQIHPRLLLPMHYFSESTLKRFLARVSDRFEIRVSPERSTIVSRATLPAAPQVLVLPGPMY